MPTMPINPMIAYYIKLGANGEWERDCLEVSQTIKFGYRETPHELCLRGEWEEVQRIWQDKRGSLSAGTAAANQIRAFYEADEHVLWVTFSGDRLYWCFCDPQILVLPNGYRIRQVIGTWSSTDVHGRPLQKTKLSGALLRMQGFRGTICKVRELEYLVGKVNGVVRPEVEAAQQAKMDFERSIEILIRQLTWKDFELLVDLLFRQAGWQRMATLGKTEKTIDLDLYSPITDERFLVQVKSSADRSKLQSFVEGIGKFEDFDRAYFIVHTPANDLIGYGEVQDNVDVWLPNDIARRVIAFGLAEWIIEKVA